MKEKISSNKIIIFMIVSVIILITLIAGSTYAFFSAQTSSGDYITGSSASGSQNLTLAVEQLSDGEGLLIPQLDSAIQKAVVGATGQGSCIDGNGSTICKVYKITVTNLMQVTTHFTATLSLNAPNMTYLKWAEGTGALTGFPTSDGIHDKSYTALDDSVLAPNGNSGSSIIYYVVIWISETGVSQTDHGSFVGTVSINAYTVGSDGNRTEGITSTFTG